ncbi:MAG: methyltransferase domain-containing protein [Deltaproteobacteria bacterium]|jgi:SAM-dependent methyltransferase|nr:methyltransferase domain-containing protein [Deltaproteobacteria bacterium]
MSDATWTPADLLKMNYDAWKAWTVQSAVVLGIFTALDKLKDEATVDSLAKAIQSDRRATEKMVTALTALELLKRDGDEISLTDFSRRHLSEESRDYLGYILVHMHQINPNWTRLARCVKSGGNARSLPEPSPEEIKDLEASRHRHFILGMYSVAVLQARTVTAALDLKGHKRLLDLGGGPGTYAAYFCAANPGLKAVVFDRPPSEAVALEILDRLGVRDRVSFQGGDFLSDPIPGDFDVVWMSQVIHGENPENAALLVKRGVEALRPGGEILIQEFVLDDDRRGPLGPALFTLNMLVQTPGGAAYAYSEIVDMLKGAGINKISEIKGALPPGNRILTGFKD